MKEHRFLYHVYYGYTKDHVVDVGAGVPRNCFSSSVITRLFVIGIELSYLPYQECLFCWRSDGRRRSDFNCINPLLTHIKLKASILFMKWLRRSPRSIHWFLGLLSFLIRYLGIHIRKTTEAKQCSVQGAHMRKLPSGASMLLARHRWY